MTTSHPEFNFSTPQKPSKATAEQVQMLREVLADGRWHRARDLRADNPELNDRLLRMIAEDHETEFVTGNEGYRLLTACTMEELAVCARRLESQARKMLARALKIRSAGHRALCHSL